MTRDDIIRMAREAGFDEWEGTDDVGFLAVIERFATIVAAAQREECAELCDRFAVRDMHPAECAAAIRKIGKP